MIYHTSYTTILMKYFLLLFSIFCCCGVSLFAQIKVTGTVSSQTDNLPIIGASVLHLGAEAGTVTDLNGEYSITVPKDAQLEFRYLGYTVQVIDVNDRSVIDVVLRENVQQLEGVVVTAFGIEKEKKATGFAFSEVDGSELTKARDVSVASQLVGKVAGLDITQPTNGPGGATRITIRGLSQFSGDNRPLIVIDGIPADNTNVNSGGLFGGRDSGDGLSSLNPDDIENITVLKGPSASALYGSRAGNGVVLITTKKGKGRSGIGVEFTSNYTTDEVFLLPNYQMEYGQGANGMRPTSQQEALDNWRSWGGRLDGSETPTFTGETLPYAAAGQDDIRDYYQRGNTFTNSVALTGGSESMNARLSLSNLRNESIVPNTSYERNTINLSTRANLSSRLSIEGKVNYVVERAKNRINLTDNPSNPAKYFTIAPANLPHQILNQTRTQDGDPIYWSSNPFTLSPYWGVNENSNRDSKNRTLGYIRANWQITDWLSLSGRMATDDNLQEFFSVEIDGTQYLPGGAIFINDVKTIERNYDAILASNHTLSDKLDLDVSVGAVRTDRFTRLTETRGNDFINPGFLSINNMAIRLPETISSNEFRVNAVFATASLAINNFLYLDGSVRNDYFSVLTNPNDVEGSANAIFYGSGSLSFILSDALSLPKWVSFTKLRAGYGTSGFGQIDPYAQVLTYEIPPVPIETGSGNVTAGRIADDEIPNPNVEPSRTTSLEFGVDLAVVNNRFGLEFTYYNQRTDKHVFPSPLPSSTGYLSQLINAGEVRNSGIELLGRATVVQTKNFSWDLSANFARNINEVLSLNEGIDQLNFGDDRTFSANIIARVGGQIGDIWGNVFARNDQGEVIYGDDGLAVIAPDRQILGNFNPDWYGGLTSSFRFKNIRFSFLLDTKQGGEILSTTSSFGYLFGRGLQTLPGRESEDFMIVGKGVGLDGVSTNTAAARIDDFYGRYSSISELNVYDASYIKLRQAMITYTLPQKLIDRIGFVNHVNLSIVGRNLFFLANGLDDIGLDPESIYTATNGDVGIEYAALPSTRTLGFNLNIGF